MRGRVIATVVVLAMAAVLVGVTRHHGAGTAQVNAGAAGGDAVAGPDTASPAVSPSQATTASTSAPSTLPAPTTTADLGATDRLEQLQPLVHVLPHDTAHYRIDYRVVGGNRLVLTIELLAVLNNANQLATYQAQLRQFKGEALDFLRSQAQVPAAYRIEYQPPEAAGL